MIYEEVQDPRSISLLVSADAGSASEARHAMRRFLERSSIFSLAVILLLENVAFKI